MYLNEATATARKLDVYLLAASGAPLPLNYVFVTGDLKIIQPDGTIANAHNLPTPVTGAADGTWRIQLDQSELQQVGNIRLQIVTSGVRTFDIWEPVTITPLAALLAAVMDPANAASSNYPANAKTFQQQWNLLMAWCLGPGDNLYGPTNGSIGPLAIGEPSSPPTHRGEFTVNSGARRWTKLDGT